MDISVERLPKSEARITVMISIEEAQSAFVAAAERLSHTHAFPGFRPGKAPYDVVKTKLGEMAIWNEAIEGLVRHAYAKAIVDNKLEPVGSPEIEMKKFAPGNPIAFTATTTILPAVLDLPKLEDVTVKAKPIIVTEKTVDEALQELQKMQTQEVTVERAATTADKVLLDVAISKAGVAVEGGTAKNHAVYLSEPYYIPGFPEQIVGLKAGDTKTFSVAFPENHFQKHLAGQPADFSVTVHEVKELQPPARDDAFAKTLGQESLAALRDLLKKNLETEEAQKEKERQEQEALEVLVTKARFEDLPGKLIDAEAEKMVHELEHSLAERGLEFGPYLANIKKTRDELKLEFTPNATKRLKTILVIRTLAKRENLAVDEAEVAEEIARTMNQYKDDPESQQQIRSDEYADSVRNILRNRKTIEYLREKTVKE
jgi:trigger factor